MRPTSAPRRRRRPVRLTPRGRLFVLVLCLVFSGVLTTLATPPGEDPPGGREAAVVPGDSAWSVPERYRGHDPGGAAGEVRRLAGRWGGAAYAGALSLPDAD